MALTRLRMDELVNAWVSDENTPFQIALLGTIPPSLLFMTDKLMKQSRDEPASYYCLVCTTVTWPADRSWAEFELDPRADMSSLQRRLDLAD